MPREIGIVPRQTILKMIDAGFIKSNIDIAEDNLQPASLDLRIGGSKIIRLPGIFPPQKGKKILRFASEISRKSNFYEIPFRGEVLLESGVPYLIPILEELDLPSTVCAKANNKSSSGRLNLQVRLLSENHQEFDTVPFGYKGKLYVIVVAGSFPIAVSYGQTLNQIRFFSGNLSDSKLNTLDIRIQHEKHCLSYNLSGRKIPWDKLKIIHGGVVLTANLDHRGDTIIAYRFVGTATQALSLNKKSDPKGFFEPILASDIGESLILAKGGFYILSTNEAFSLPPELCSEMVAYKNEIGEYRSHFAGFFDPGWGFTSGRKGTPGVLEIIPHEDMMLFHGQPVCVMDIYHMLEKPDVSYGDAGNNYADQVGPRLSKYFNV